MIYDNDKTESLKDCSLNNKDYTKIDFTLYVFSERVSYDPYQCKESKEERSEESEEEQNEEEQEEEEEYVDTDEYKSVGDDGVYSKWILKIKLKIRCTFEYLISLIRNTMNSLEEQYKKKEEDVL